MQNFIKTIINAAQSWTKKEIKDSVADWNQNDSSADSYVKNRTHYVEATEEIVFCPEMAFDFAESSYGKTLPAPVPGYFVEGQTYKVYYDDTCYECVAFDHSGYGGVGNPALSNVGEDNGMPFLLVIYWGEVSDYEMYAERSTTGTAETHTISITTMDEVIHTIDPKYLPEECATVAEVQATANTKMDKSNPVGTGSFSMNRKSGTTIGTNSVAVCYNTTASGEYSYAEGNSTTASGYNSHAEGMSTNASSNNQHVQGAYNIEDSADKYAHIVGNGDSNIARSNAHTLDWNGVGWFQGGLQVGGNAQDGEGVGYVPSAPAGAQVGQLLAVKAVDENGRPTEWETVDVVSKITLYVQSAQQSEGDGYLYHTASGATNSDESARVSKEEFNAIVESYIVTVKDNETGFIMYPSIMHCAADFGFLKINEGVKTVYTKEYGVGPM